MANLQNGIVPSGTQPNPIQSAKEHSWMDMAKAPFAKAEGASYDKSDVQKAAIIYTVAGLLVCKLFSKH